MYARILILWKDVLDLLMSLWLKHMVDITLLTVLLVVLNTLMSLWEVCYIIVWLVKTIFVSISRVKPLYNELVGIIKIVHNIEVLLQRLKSKHCIGTTTVSLIQRFSLNGRFHCIYPSCMQRVAGFWCIETNQHLNFLQLYGTILPCMQQSCRSGWLALYYYTPVTHEPDLMCLLYTTLR